MGAPKSPPPAPSPAGGVRRPLSVVVTVPPSRPRMEPLALTALHRHRELEHIRRRRTGQIRRPTGKIPTEMCRGGTHQARSPAGVHRADFAPSPPRAAEVEPSLCAASRRTARAPSAPPPCAAGGRAPPRHLVARPELPPRRLLAWPEVELPHTASLRVRSSLRATSARGRWLCRRLHTRDRKHREKESMEIGREEMP
jgi:hypothetical protein